MRSLSSDVRYAIGLDVTPLEALCQLPHDRARFGELGRKALNLLAAHSADGVLAHVPPSPSRIGASGPVGVASAGRWAPDSMAFASSMTALRASLLV